MALVHAAAVRLNPLLKNLEKSNDESLAEGLLIKKKIVHWIQLDGESQAR
jgi:hypothetical protein